MRKYIFIILVSITFQTCFYMNITDSYSTPPYLPDLDEFYKIINLVDTTLKIEQHNWNAVIYTLQYWNKNITNFDSLALFYKAASDSNAKHFAGDTWYWEANYQNYKITIYATYVPIDFVIYEAYFENINKLNSTKFLDGQYNTTTHKGEFSFEKDSLSLTIDWITDETTINYTFSIISDTLNILTDIINVEQNYDMLNLISTFNNQADTAFINYYYNNSGKIKFHKYFNDYLWHCWDINFRDTECDDDKF